VTSGVRSGSTQKSLTLDEVRKMRAHEEGHYSAMEKITSATVNSSSDISGIALNVK
jgi:hypothetical protein